MFAVTIARLRDMPGCVGYHLCGAYLRNECRKRALRDAAETPDTEAITAANAEARPLDARGRVDMTPPT